TRAHTSVEKRTDVGPRSTPGHTRMPARSSFPLATLTSSPITAPSSTTDSPIRAPRPSTEALTRAPAPTRTPSNRPLPPTRAPAADPGARPDHGAAARPRAGPDLRPVEQQHAAGPAASGGEGGRGEPSKHEIT